MESVRWYPSKVDPWIWPALAIGPVATVGVTVAAIVAGQRDAVIVGLVATGVIAAVYLGLVFPVLYAIEGDHLLVQFGLVRQRVPLREIREVHPTRNPLSSPALSLDRLRIQFGEGFFKAVMISPADREAFLEELAARAGLRRDGDRLVRP